MTPLVLLAAPCALPGLTKQCFAQCLATNRTAQRAVEQRMGFAGTRKGRTWCLVPQVRLGIVVP